MNALRFLQRLKHLCKRASSLLMLFQRTPAAQLLIPAELNLASSMAAMDVTAKLAIATVAGLGAYDSVAGATTLEQLSPNSGSDTLTVTAGDEYTAIFHVQGSPGEPGSWETVGTLPAGLSFTVDSPRYTARLTGTTFAVGTHFVTVRAWEQANLAGGTVQTTFTINVLSSAAAISTQPGSPTINRGQATILTVGAVGAGALSYQWFQGSSGDTSLPVGTNSPNFTTPILLTTTSYWVKVTNAANPGGANSNTATVTVRQPATITDHPDSVEITGGQDATLTVTATGDAPLTYQWYEGLAGMTNKPVGTNSPSFTTPPLAATTSYWVKVTNVANTSGALSNVATVTVLPPPNPTVFTASPLATARKNIFYTTTFAAIGGTTPYTWSVEEGSSLPAGLTLASNGTFSGTPTATGTSTFTVKVSDFEGDIGTKAMTLTVSDLTISTATLATAVKGVAYSHQLVATGGSGAFTWSQAGGAFPTGIDINAAGLIAGTTNSTGDSLVSVRVTDGTGFAVTRVLTLPVSATFIKPVVNAPAFPLVTVGASFTYPVTALNHPKTFTITGLPKGLKAAADGKITGIPEVAGIFNVQIRATNSAGPGPLLTAKLTVKALPKHLVGSFAGTISRNESANRGLGGLIQLTVTSLGGYTLKHAGALPNIPAAKGASVSTTVIGRIAASAPNISITLGGAALTLNIDPQTSNLGGNLGSATITGWRSYWNALTQPAEDLTGYYSMALDLASSGDRGVVSIPQGSGFATFSVARAGTLTIAGKTADGENVTFSTFLSDQGDIGMFVPQYKGLGTLQGTLKITTDPLAEFAGNMIGGTLSWYKPGTVTRTYGPSFGPLTLAVEGGYLAPASTGNIILGLPDIGSAQLRFTDGGLAVSTMDPDTTFTYTDDNKIVPPAALDNPAKATVAINAATGAVTGNFTLVESVTNFTRPKVPFFGQVVRKADGSVRAVGYFLLAQIPSGTQKPTDTQILSGGVQVQSGVPQ